MQVCVKACLCDNKLLFVEEIAAEKAGHQVEDTVVDKEQVVAVHQLAARLKLVVHCAQLLDVQHLLHGAGQLAVAQHLAVELAIAGHDEADFVRLLVEHRVRHFAVVCGCGCCCVCGAVGKCASRVAANMP